MKVVQVLKRLGGVATTAELRRHVPRGKLRSAVRRGHVLRDARGHYVLAGAEEDLRAAHRLSGVLCFDSAARHHGWKLKHPPRTPAVAVPRNRKVARHRRRGVRLAYLDVGPGEQQRHATSYLRTVMDCASRLPFDEALAIADSALRAGDVTEEQLLRAAQRVPRLYRTRCLRVAEEADGRADNPFESVLRAISLDVRGLRLVPQVWVEDIGRADLVDEALGLVVEAESFEFHGIRRMLKRDCERYNAFVLHGRLVVRFAWEHVMFDPAYVTDVLAAAVRRLAGQPERRAPQVRQEARSA